MGSKTLKLQSIQQPEPTMTNDSQSELEAANAKLKAIINKAFTVLSRWSLKRWPKIAKPKV